MLMAMEKIKANSLVLPLLLILISALLTSALSDENPAVDPQRRLEQCKRRCRDTERGEHRRLQCERSCEEDFRSERDEESWVNPDSQEKLRRCKMECRSQQYGPQTQRRCESRCERRYGEESERTGWEGDKDFFFNGDPRQKYRECREKCERHEHDPRWHQRCRRECEERYEEERTGIPLERDDEINRDPKQKYREECRQWCERQEHDPSRQQECWRECEERHRSEKGRGGSESYEYGKDPEEQYQECRRMCEWHEGEPRARQQCLRECKDRRRSERGRNRRLAY